jgi:catechol 2,3-dioxygenase-like lactoylglutathione lyase family enzyme
MVSTRDIIIQTDRLDAARAFYRDVMRFEQTNTDMLGFETGSFRLYIEPGDSPGPVFEFEVEDLVSAKALLLANGCSIAEEDPMLPRLYIRDPFGLVFNITEGQAQ